MPQDGSNRRYAGREAPLRASEHYQVLRVLGEEGAFIEISDVQPS